MWLKVQPLCEKVQCNPPFLNCAPVLIPRQILECASALGHSHVMMGGGGGQKFRDDAMALLREVAARCCLRPTRASARLNACSC